MKGWNKCRKKQRASEHLLTLSGNAMICFSSAASEHDSSSSLAAGAIPCSDSRGRCSDASVCCAFPVCFSSCLLLHASQAAGSSAATMHMTHCAEWRCFTVIRANDHGIQDHSVHCSCLAKQVYLVGLVLDMPLPSSLSLRDCVPDLLLSVDSAEGVSNPLHAALQSSSGAGVLCCLSDSFDLDNDRACFADSADKICEGDSLESSLTNPVPKGCCLLCWKLLEQL